jgi:hypothetical protein
MGKRGRGGAPPTTVLLERSDVMSQLDGLLAGIATAGGQAVLVSGEAGIGKSALVRQFAQRHEADARCLLGVCDPLLTPRALGPLHDIARQARGRLAEVLATGGSREAVFAAFLDELEQGPQRRAVVMVEDAHWADEATLDLLVFIGRRLERIPALLLVTYRDDELGAEHPLRGAVAGLPPRAGCAANGCGRCRRGRSGARPAGRSARGRGAWADRREPAACHRGARGRGAGCAGDGAGPGSGSPGRVAAGGAGGGATGRGDSHPGGDVAGRGGAAPSTGDGGGGRLGRAAGRG